MSTANSNRGLWTIAIVFGSLFALFLAFVAILFGAMSKGPVGENQIGVIEIQGPIIGSDKTVKALREFAKDDDIRGVVIRIDTPGGTVAASQEIYEAIKGLGKPAVISLGNVAASGGFYIACAGPRVFANPGTITGSIGVIAQTVEVDALMDYLQLKVNTVTSGALKDSGSPFRDFTERDRKHYEALVMDIYDQFVETVATARKKKRAEIIPFADGRVMTGKQALKAGLVDELGGMQAAIDYLAGELNIEDEPTLVYPEKESSGLLDLIVDKGMSSVGRHIEGASTPSFEYRYVGPM